MEGSLPPRRLAPPPAAASRPAALCAIAGPQLLASAAATRSASRPRSDRSSTSRRPRLGSWSGRGGRSPSAVVEGGGANVLFFTRKAASSTPWTRDLWVYDLRTNQRFTLKTRSLKREDLDKFVAAYRAGERERREESECFKRWSYEELAERPGLNLDTGRPSAMSPSPTRLCCCRPRSSHSGSSRTSPRRSRPLPPSPPSLATEAAMTSRGRSTMRAVRIPFRRSSRRRQRARHAFSRVA